MGSSTEWMQIDAFRMDDVPNVDPAPAIEKARSTVTEKDTAEDRVAREPSGFYNGNAASVEEETTFLKRENPPELSEPKTTVESQDRTALDEAPRVVSEQADELGESQQFLEFRNSQKSTSFKSLIVSDNEDAVKDVKQASSSSSVSSYTSSATKQFKHPETEPPYWGFMASDKKERNRAKAVCEGNHKKGCLTLDGITLRNLRKDVRIPRYRRLTASNNDAVVCDPVVLGSQRAAVHVRLRPLTDIDILHDALPFFCPLKPEKTANGDDAAVALTEIKDIHSLPLKTSDTLRTLRTKVGTKPFYISGRCFPETTCNSEFYLKTIQNAVLGMTEGIHTAVLGLGLNGSGRFHSLFGTAQHLGLFPQALADLFSHLECYNNVRDSPVGSYPPSFIRPAVWNVLKRGSKTADAQRLHFIVRMAFLDLSQEHGLQVVRCDAAVPEERSEVTLLENLTGSPFGSVFEPEGLTWTVLRNLEDALKLFARVLPVWRERKSKNGTTPWSALCLIRVERVVVSFSPLERRRTEGGVGTLNTFLTDITVIERTEGSMAFVVPFDDSALALTQTTLRGKGVGDNPSNLSCLLQTLTELSSLNDTQHDLEAKTTARSSALTQILYSYLFNHQNLVILCFVNPSTRAALANQYLLNFATQVSGLYRPLGVWHTAWSHESYYCNTVLKYVLAFQDELKRLANSRVTDERAKQEVMFQMQTVMSEVIPGGYKKWSVLRPQNQLRIRHMLFRWGIVEQPMEELEVKQDDKVRRRKAEENASVIKDQKSAGAIHPVVARDLRKLREQQQELVKRLDRLQTKDASIRRKKVKNRKQQLLSKLDKGLSFPQPPADLIKSNRLNFPSYPKQLSLSEPEMAELNVFQTQYDDTPKSTASGTSSVSRSRARSQYEDYPKSWPLFSTPSLADNGVWLGPEKRTETDALPTCARLKHNPIRIFLSHLLDPSSAESSTESGSTSNDRSRRRMPKAERRTDQADRRRSRSKTRRKSRHKSNSKTIDRQKKDVDDAEQEEQKLPKSSSDHPSSLQKSLAKPQRPPRISAAGAIQIAREGGFKVDQRPPALSQIPYGGVGIAGGYPHGGLGSNVPPAWGGAPLYYPIKPTLEHHYAPAGLAPFATFQYPVPPKETKPIVVHLHQHDGKSTDVKSVNVGIEKKDDAKEISKEQAVSLATAAAVRQMQHDDAQQPTTGYRDTFPVSPAVQPFDAAPPGSYTVPPPGVAGFPSFGGFPPSPSHLKLGFEGAVDVDPAFLKRRHTTSTSLSSSTSYESRSSQRKKQASRSSTKRQETRKRRFRKRYRSDEVDSSCSDRRVSASPDAKKKEKNGRTSHLIRKERRRLTKKLLQQLYYHPDTGGLLAERTLHDLLPLLQPFDRQKLVDVIENYRKEQKTVKRRVKPNQQFCDQKTVMHRPDIADGKRVTFDNHLGVPVSYLSSSSTTSLSSMSTPRLRNEIDTVERVGRKHQRAVLRGDVGSATERTTMLEARRLEEVLRSVGTDELLHDVLKSPLDTIRQEYLQSPQMLSPPFVHSSPDDRLAPSHNLPRYSSAVPHIPETFAGGQRQDDVFMSEGFPFPNAISATGHTVDVTNLHDNAQLLQKDVRLLLQRISAKESQHMQQPLSHEFKISASVLPTSTHRSRSSSLSSVDGTLSLPRISVTTIPFASPAPPVADAPDFPTTKIPSKVHFLKVPAPSSCVPTVPEAESETPHLRTAQVPAETPVTVNVRGTATLEGDTSLLSDMGRVIGLSPAQTGMPPMYYPYPSPAQLGAPQADTASAYPQEAFTRDIAEQNIPDYVAELKMPSEEEDETRRLAPTTYLPPPHRSQLPPDAGSPLPLSSLAWGGAEATESTIVNPTGYPTGSAHFSTVWNPEKDKGKARHRFEQPAANWETLGMLAGTEDISVAQLEWQRSLRPYLSVPWRTRVEKTFHKMRERIAKHHINTAETPRSEPNLTTSIDIPETESDGTKCPVKDKTPQETRAACIAAEPVVILKYPGTTQKMIPNKPNVLCQMQPITFREGSPCGTFLNSVRSNDTDGQKTADELENVEVAAATQQTKTGTSQGGLKNEPEIILSPRNNTSHQEIVLQARNVISHPETASTQSSMNFLKVSKESTPERHETGQITNDTETETTHPEEERKSETNTVTSERHIEQHQPPLLPLADCDRDAVEQKPTAFTPQAVSQLEQKNNSNYFETDQVVSLNTETRQENSVCAKDHVQVPIVTGVLVQDNGPNNILQPLKNKECVNAFGSKNANASVSSKAQLSSPNHFVPTRSHNAKIRSVPFCAQSNNEQSPHQRSTQYVPDLPQQCFVEQFSAPKPTSRIVSDRLHNSSDDQTKSYMPHPVTLQPLYLAQKPYKLFRRRLSSRSPPSKSLSRASTPRMFVLASASDTPRLPSLIGEQELSLNDAPTIVAKGIIDAPVFRHRVALRRRPSHQTKRWS